MIEFVNFIDVDLFIGIDFDVDCLGIVECDVEGNIYYYNGN